MSIASGEYARGFDWFDVAITRAAGFGDGEVGHSGSLSLAESPHEGVRGPAWCFHGGNASAFWVALGRGLAEFYGGVVDYNDCDETEADVIYPKTVRARVNRGDADYEAQRLAVKFLGCVTDERGLKRLAKVGGIYNYKGEYVRTADEKRRQREYARRTSA